MAKASDSPTPDPVHMDPSPATLSAAGARRWRLAPLASSIAAGSAGVVVAAALFLHFPNLQGNPLHLALVLLTPLLCGVALGAWSLRRARAVRREPLPARLAVTLLYGL